LFPIFALGERAGLGQDVVGDSDLADVVEQAAEARAQHFFFGEAQAMGDRG